MRGAALFFICLTAAFWTKAQTPELKSVVGASIGIGNLYYGKSYDPVVPPLMAFYEYRLSDNAFGINNLSIGTGGAIGFMKVRSVTTYGDATLTSKLSEVTIALKITGHYPLIPSAQWDTYGTVLIGWGIANNRNSWEGNDETIALAKSLGWENEAEIGGPAFGIMAGCRYLFTDNLAANVEIGYGPAFFNFGCCYLF